jgi:hypothetical protein
LRIRLTILILFLSISLQNYAQQVEDNSTWIIKGNASSLIDIFTFPTAQISIEKRLTNYFSLCAEAGYQLYDFRQPDTIYLRPKGFKINVECRFYVSKFLSSELVSKTDGVYIGLQPFYRKNQYTAGISYYTKLDTLHQNAKSEDFGVKKTVYGLNCLIGIQKQIHNKLVVDLYAGLGIMQRDIKNPNRLYNNESSTILAGTDLVPLFESLNLSESSGPCMNFLIGLRVGYKL